MSSGYTCEQQFSKEVDKFEGVVYLSLSLTVVFLLVRSFCKFRDHPGRGSKILGCFALFKLMLGILLFTVLNPICPEGCSCGSHTKNYLYPTVVILISIYWAYLGYKYNRQHQQQQQQQVLCASNCPTDDDVEMS